MSNTKRYAWTNPQDLNGRVITDPFGHFKQSDLDATGDPQYAGFVTIDGVWYISKMSNNGETTRYATGSGGYATAWTNRASLGYDRVDIAF